MTLELNNCSTASTTVYKVLIFGALFRTSSLWHDTLEIGVRGADELPIIDSNFEAGRRFIRLRNNTTDHDGSLSD